MKATDKSKSAVPAKAKGKKYAVPEKDNILYAADFEVAYQKKQFFTDDISLLNRAKKGLNANAALDFLSLWGVTQDEFQELLKLRLKLSKTTLLSL